jgi:hypothetical protein
LDEFVVDLSETILDRVVDGAEIFQDDDATELQVGLCERVRRRRRRLGVRRRRGDDQESGRHRRFHRHGSEDQVFRVEAFGGELRHGT